MYLFLSYFVAVTAGASALGLAYAFYKKLNQPQKGMGEKICTDCIGVVRSPSFRAAGVSSKSEYAINVAASSTGRSKRRVGE